MIDNLPGSDESANPFSARGDSGSFVCKTRLVNNVSLMNHSDEPRVTAISMIHCGELHIGGEESDQTISFRLKKGLQLLSEKSGKRFVPS
ncbi:hypothetical protein DPMN_066299 [Dreissena polymorpha]|uniref:Uncharacterized protein n=1 Tax=Dreissena polymorpha TaxID=45954 RepID=A0A9D4BUX1_DREPO|nr:hypothetical protein DPMN_066299 [Dreissena polymorpha]